MPNNLTDAEEIRLLDLSAVANDKVALMSVAGTDAAAGTEVNGGTYAAQTATFAGAAGGSKPTTAALAFTGMPATEVQGWALYDSTKANRKWYGVLARTLATAQDSGNTITAAAHGRANGSKVVFQSGYAPAGLVANTTYFVVGATANTFQVAATTGGAAIDITADSPLVVFGTVYDVTAGSTFTVAAGDLTLTFS